MKNFFPILNTFLFSFVFGYSITLSAQKNPCSNPPPASIKDALTYFNEWPNTHKLGTAFLFHLLDIDIESAEFGDAVLKSNFRIAPFQAAYEKNKLKSCLIPENISKKLSNGTESQLHYGMILPNPDKSIIVLYMMDEVESMGFAILDKNTYEVIYPWESFDLMLGKYIYDLEVIGNRFITYSYGGLMSGISSTSRAEYIINKSGVKTAGAAKFDKKDLTKYIPNIPAIKNFDRNDHDGVVEYYEKTGLTENGVGLYKTVSGVNLLLRTERFDQYNFAFLMAVLDNQCNIKGEWQRIYYFGGVASAEAMSYFDTDARFEGDKIICNTIHSLEGVVNGNNNYEFKITSEGIVEIKSDNSTLLKSLNTVNLPLKISCSGRDAGKLSGFDAINKVSKTLNDRDRQKLLPNSGWGPYDRTDMFTAEGSFVLLKTTDGINVIAATEYASLTQVLHLQVVDAEGKAIGKAFDYILAGMTPDGRSGACNGIEIKANGDILLNYLSWSNDYNTGEPKPDEKSLKTAKITKNGIIVK